MDEDLDYWASYIKDVTKLDNSNISPKDRFPLKTIKTPYQDFNNTSSTIDLHGLTQDQAFTQLETFLKYNYNNNTKEIIIITGKGLLNSPGVIKLAVPRWLEYTELKKYIIGYSSIQDSLGGSGSIRVTIKKR